MHRPNPTPAPPSLPRSLTPFFTAHIPSASPWSKAKKQHLPPTLCQLLWFKPPNWKHVNSCLSHSSTFPTLTYKVLCHLATGSSSSPSPWLFQSQWPSSGSPNVPGLGYLWPCFPSARNTFPPGSAGFAASHHQISAYTSLSSKESLP